MLKAQSQWAQRSTDVTAEIPSYTAPGLPLIIKGQSQTSLQNMAQWVNHSPVSAMIGDPFVGTKATGDASLELFLNIPITDLEKTEVSGTVHLNGNMIAMKNVPEMTQAKGSVTFTEKGLWASELTAQIYGCPTTGEISTDEKGKNSYHGPC